MVTPLQVKQSLNSLITSTFGSFNELETLLSSRDLEYIYNFPNKIVIYKLWEINLDLIALGKESTDEYQILDKHLNFIKTIYNSNDLSSDIDILKYLFNLNHGDYIHLAFKKNGGFEIILVWVIKEKTNLEKQQLVNKWTQIKNQNQPTFYRNGEVTINNPLNGWVQIYSISGDLLNIPSISQFFNNNDSTLVVSSKISEINFSPILNRWYAIFLITNNKVDLMYLTNIKGSGLQKISQQNGIIYLSILDNSEQEESVDRLTTNKLSITSDLKPALLPVNNLSFNLSKINKTITTEPRIRQFNSVAFSVNDLIANKVEEINYLTLNGVSILGDKQSEILDKNVQTNYIVENVEYIISSLTDEKNKKELTLMT